MQVFVVYQGGYVFGVGMFDDVMFGYDGIDKVCWGYIEYWIVGIDFGCYLLFVDFQQFVIVVFFDWDVFVVFQVYVDG